MKNLIFMFLVIVTLSACISKVNIKEERPHLGEVRTTNIGDLFFAKIDCYGDDNGMGKVYNGECYKYDLSLIGVTDDQITLQYREYMKPVNKYGAYKIKNSWLLKDGFTRDLEYSTKDDYITYKNHKFKIMEINTGSIT